MLALKIFLHNTPVFLVSRTAQKLNEKYLYITL